MSLEVRIGRITVDGDVRQARGREAVADALERELGPRLPGLDAVQRRAVADRVADAVRRQVEERRP